MQDTGPKTCRAPSPLIAESVHYFQTGVTMPRHKPHESRKQPLEQCRPVVSRCVLCVRGGVTLVNCKSRRAAFSLMDLLALVLTGRRV